jgi:hypothetical protein
MDDQDLDELIRRFEYYCIGSQSEIPARFQREFHGEPFLNCDLCNRNLLEEGVTYLIGKYYQGDDLSQESSICTDCIKKIREGYSEQSTEVMKNVFSEDAKHERLVFASKIRSNQLEKMTSNCLLCGRSKKGVEAYFEYAVCRSDKFIYFVHPYMHCQDCMIELITNLSDETNQFRERYYAQYYGLPPSDGIKVPWDYVEMHMF